MTAPTAIPSGNADITDRSGYDDRGIPCCDSGPPLLVYDAEVIVQGKGRERKIPISKWFLGPRKTALKSDEFVKGLSIMQPGKKHAGCYV